jgi:MoaA/NifB/PqqE/SkfB family radical SAM enzyme
MKILKVEWLLTRRCDLKCDYCKIRDNSSLKGVELDYLDVIDGVEYIHKRFPGVPIIFFGGEPTVLDWLPNLVDYCEKIGLKYAVISNSRRILSDEEYFERLIQAGISNWSVSMDEIPTGVVNTRTPHHKVKGEAGFLALKKFQEHGVKDLVTCTTVTKHNIDKLPELVKFLSSHGIWSITTPLQLGGNGYDYSKGSKSDQCTDEKKIREISGELYRMARSGKYLMHNHPDFYASWEIHFTKLDWKCSHKTGLTIDADGSLKRCVDKKGGLEKFNIRSLPTKEKQYEEALAKEYTCRGCYWDPAYETELRGEWRDQKVALGSFRHELSSKQLSQLLPECRRWFE